MTDVFISYARRDIARAEMIKTGLEQLGLTVFFDMEGLDSGDVFPDVLDKLVKNAKAIVGVWSTHSLTRPWVRIECDIGRTRGVLIPVRIETIDAMDLPAAFWNLQHDDLSQFDGDYSHPSWLRFVRSLARTLGRPDIVAIAQAGLPPLSAARYERSATASSPRASRRGRGASHLVIASVVAVLVAAGAAAWLLLPGNTPATQQAVAPLSTQSASLASPQTAGAAGDTAWEAAVRDRSIEAFKAYVTLFPEGSHIAEARAMIDVIEATIANQKADQLAEQTRAAEAQRQNERDAWLRTKAVATASAYEAFLAIFSDGEHVAEARANLATARESERLARRALEDDTAWEVAKLANTPAAYQNYLSAFPKGRHATEVRFPPVPASSPLRANPSTPSDATAAPSVAWTSPTNPQTVSGKTSLLSATEGKDGSECRTVRQLVVVNGVEESQDVQFCRQPGGQWQKAG